MPETALVTGGTGYVGGWCIAKLLERGYRVRATVRSHSKEQAVRDAVATRVDAGDRLEFAIADLTSDQGWDAAVAGVDFVLHVASPMGGSGATPEALVAAARDGALRVVRAAAEAGVRRVVMTSAANTASPSSYTEDSVTDETLWTDPEDPTLIPYRRSKTLAELAAWDYMAGYEGPTELTTVLPGAVFGPILSTATTGSTGIVAQMLTGAMPGVPRIGLEVVDVRDLADIHIRAMTSPKAAGERFLATGEFIWMADMAKALKEELGHDGENVSTQEIPDEVVRANPAMGEIAPALGRRNRHTTDKARTVLDWQPRPARDTVVDCARSLLTHGVV
ncbi:aldehyde reductase [Streptomyces malaysiensis subsp. malaysiensis]|uniref:NAD-dependent epimerase/dehydratase family protein n=1 Tax=Streptomyces malaysiensis TaxID=92644 RepID=UPI000BFD8250|nr:NAD-dependent epimerase/dehydratase family protein [Streptomyces malaysiensis]ATL81050.1 NAD-dependent epimerase/dehydratase [Streptomyces malaysiensis]QDL74413.1 aldehyde reductase [Streptomyces malaysiensis]